jgi:flagellum-specific peptidoglycan hydrolase FlgJ
LNHLKGLPAMKKRENEHAGQLHCRNCNGYYDPSLPTCPHCGEDTANNTHASGSSLSIEQYAGGFGTAGSPLGRAALLIIIVLLLVALLSLVVVGVQALSNLSLPAVSQPSVSDQSDPADSSEEETSSAAGSASAEASVSAEASASQSAEEQPKEEEPKTQEPETEPAPPASPTSISLSLDDMTLLEGGVYQLTTTISPSNWEGTLVWSSDNESVATVTQDGTVTYVGAGTCYVTVTANETTARCIVRCTAPKVEEPKETTPTATEEPKKETTTPTTAETEISVKYDDVSLYIGDQFDPEPSGGNGTYTWSSADTSVATVDKNGIITVTGTGRTTITCTSGSKSVQIVVRSMGVG